MKSMSTVTARENESLETLIKRFKKKVDNEGILKEYRYRQYFVKPSMKKRLKMKESIRKQYVKNLKKQEELK